MAYNKFNHGAHRFIHNFETVGDFNSSFPNGLSIGDKTVLHVVPEADTTVTLYLTFDSKEDIEAGTASFAKYQDITDTDDYVIVLPEYGPTGIDFSLSGTDDAEIWVST